MTQRKNSRNVDMLHGPLAGPIILFALPLAVSSMLQQLFNAADTAVVGRFASSQAMAAVGSNSSVINLVVALFVGLSVGTNVVIAGLIGRGKREEISTAVHTAVVVALMSDVFLVFVGISIARPMLTMMNTPEDVLDLAVANDIIDKSGAWFAYNGDKIGQGRENAKNFLQENPDIMYEIEQKVRMAYGLPSDLAEEMESAAGETEE